MRATTVGLSTSDRSRSDLDGLSGAVGVLNTRSPAEDRPRRSRSIEPVAPTILAISRLFRMPVIVIQKKNMMVI
jgi:hypothetical protein